MQVTEVSFGFGGPMDALTLQIEDRAIADAMIALDPGRIREIRSRSFDGAEPVISLIVLVTPILLREISKIVQKCIESRQHVRVFYKGVEIEGVSEAVLLQLLDRTTGAPGSDDHAAG
jgi:hypothetical protein